MGTTTIGKDGIEYIHTNVLIPRYLRDFARMEGISMSRLLKNSLEKKYIKIWGNGQ